MKFPEDHPANTALVRLVTHPVTTWFVRTVCSPLDPLIFRATNGRFFTMGAPDDGMITLTMTGRKTGRLRSVHLACVPDGDDLLVIASAMGQEKHPGWRYNLEANPEVEVQAVGERYKARAEVLSDEAQMSAMPAIRAAIPMVYVYEKRTDRKIRVFRIVRT